MPILSMTGFGAGEAEVAGARVRVEIRSVNHRYLDVAVKTPREWVALESRVVEAVRGRLRRGKVDVFLSRRLDAAAPGAVRADLDLARGYRHALQALAQDLALPGEVTLELIAAQRDVLVAGAEAPDPEVEWPGVESALAKALERIGAMRAEEGRRLGEDLARHAVTLRGLVEDVAKRAPKALEEHRARLEERLAKLLGEGFGGAASGSATPLDPARLHQEVALLAERTDIEEELVRLKSHLAQLDSMIASGAEIGRKLDFLLQEIGREVNTIGSKGNDVEVGRLVVEMKSVAEKIREQVQNVE